jgi:PAS domain S-box-containing protein
LAALAGWVFKAPWLAAFGSGKIPMAPSTAVLFLLLGSALFFQARWRDDRRPGTWATLAGGVSLAAALILLASSSKGIYFQLETLGFSTGETVAGAPVGHMSPLTAACFALIATSFLLWRHSGGRSFWIGAFWGAASLAALVGVALILAYLFGAPILYGSGLVPPALTTSLAFLALAGSLLAMGAGSLKWHNGDWTTDNRRTMYILFMVLGLFAVAGVTAGRLYIHKEQEQHRAEVERGLSLVADMKVGELVGWRLERLRDAALFLNNVNFSGLVKRFLENPDDADAVDRLRTWLSKIQAGHKYERVFILNAQGQEQLSVYGKDKEPISSSLLKEARTTLDTGRIIFLDFQRDAPGGQPYLAVMTPLWDQTAGDRPLGVLVYKINPAWDLYPVIQRWPTPSGSAETYLVRREGGDVLFLNDLKREPDAALRLKMPLTMVDCPAVQAVLGREGIVDGVDHQGGRVIAAVRTVPDSPWFLVAQLGSSEVYAPLRTRLYWMIGFVSVLLLCAVTAVGALWQRNQKAQYRKLAEAEAALRASQDRYRRVLDDMLEGYQILDREWRYLYLNDTAAAHGRRAKDELLGQSLVEIYPGVENTPLFAALRCSMDNRVPMRLENEFKYPNGQNAWYELSIQPVPEGVGILSLDVTERRRAEEMVERSEKTLRTMFESIRDGIIVADIVQERFVMVNTAICRMLGYTAEEMMTFSLKDIHPQDRLEEVHQTFVRQATGEIALAHDIPVQRKDGSIFYADVNANPLDLAGRPSVLGVFRDITDRKEAENRIAHLNQVLDTIRGVNQLIVQEKDRDRLIRETCRRLIRHHGYSKALVVLVDAEERPIAHAQAGFGDEFEAMQGLFDRGELPPCCHEARKRGQAVIIKERALCAGCPLVDLFVHAQTMCAGLVHENLSFGYLLVAMDREIVADDEELNLFAEMAGDLGYALHSIRTKDEGAKAESEREKLQNQLLQAQKMDAVGRLAGGVAHDFNNMLSVILGYTEMILNQPDHDGALRADLGEIQKAAERSADLTRQLLAFARKQTIAPRPLDLNDAVSGMLKMLGRLIGEDIDLLWKPARNLWPVKMDPAQIDQLLANLVVNARDAIAGVGKVTIETGKAEFDEAYCADHFGFTPGRYVQLVVSDNGCGMDKDTQTRIFEPFFTTKPQGQGTGLGLATVYGIVRQNNGFINVYSEPGQGTTFHVYLPRHETQADIAGEVRERRDTPTGWETVLLVEDQEALLRLGKRLVERLGYKVLAANGPEKALEMAAGHPGTIHLLMTDVIMPVMSGRDLWQKLAASRPDLKCLYMSGYTTNVIAHHGILDEGVHFLQKPFSLEALAAKLREALED